MNAERLHALARSLLNELETRQAHQLLAQLVAGLEALASNPADASTQETVSQLRTTLDEALIASATNDYSPQWKQTLTELGIDDLFGDKVQATIHSVLDSNVITPSAALSEIRPIAERLSAIQEALASMVDAFDVLDIASEDLEPGEFEIAIVIPRSEAEEFRELGVEFVQLDKMLMPFVALATRSGADFRVRSIASSSFQVFLESHHLVALAIITAIERLTAFYSKYLDIRIAHRTLAESDMSDERLEPIRAHVDEYMEGRIEELCEELIVRFWPGDLDEGQANELRTHLKVALRHIAARLDRGYDFDVREGPVPNDEAEVEELRASGALNEAMERSAHEIAEKRRRIERLQLDGSSILSLPPPISDGIAEEQSAESSSESADSIEPEALSQPDGADPTGT